MSLHPQHWYASHILPVTQKTLHVLPKTNVSDLNRFLQQFTANITLVRNKLPSPIHMRTHQLNFSPAETSETFISDHHSKIFIKNVAFKLTFNILPEGGNSNLRRRTGEECL